MRFPVTVHGKTRPSFTQTQAGERHWYIPEEVPIAFVFNKRNYAVMMGTPDDLVDFAVGFSLTEEIIKSPDDIVSLDIKLSDKGADLRFKISDNALTKMDVVLRRRNMVGSASCGLCGLENADTLFKVLPKVANAPIEIKEAACTKAMAALRGLQPVNQKTHSVHAAAWVTHDGGILHVREDVGRHNALDKLLGALKLADTDMTSGFVLMSSRCSYEIVEKAAKCGVQAILSISGPTAFALRKAESANMAIYARSGETAVRLL